MSSICSMTGFGRAESVLSGQPLTVELKSVNHRYNDIRVHLPSALQEWEPEIRRHLKTVIHRGRTEATIRFGEESCNTMPALDLPLAQRYQELFSTLQTHQNDSTTPLSTEVLFSLPGVVFQQPLSFSRTQNRDSFFETLEEALQSLGEMRRQEGEHLYRDISMRSQQLKKHLTSIQEHAQLLPTQQMQKWSTRLQELLKETSVEPSRIHQEAAIWSDKLDVSEEITRAFSHIQQMQRLLESGGVIGRQLDFLCQELLREANTIGVKAQMKELFNDLLPFKVEVEKIREQAQNIE